MFFPQCWDSTPKCVGHPDRSYRLGTMENCMQLHINLGSMRLGILDMLFQFYVFFKIVYNALLSNSLHEAMEQSWVYKHGT